MSKETKKMKALGRKRAASPVIENVIFIVLNIMFFAMIAFFVVKSASSAAFYEQAYAKEAALLIDNAKPGMGILVDAEDALKVARGNGVKDKDIARIEKAESRVVIKLSNKGSYSFQYFNDNDISVAVQGIYLKIEVKENA